MHNDRNFDDLAPRFARNIYNTMKGQIRLAVLRRDFSDHIPQLLQANGAVGWSVLDVGAGQGQFSLSLTESGCDLVLNDISHNMLEYANNNIAELVKQKKLEQGKVSVVHGSLQASIPSLATYDLVVCHAVIEWVENPEAFVNLLVGLVKPGGFLSVIFYNYNGLAFKNLLRTNFNKFDYHNFTAFRGSLTPTNPQQPVNVLQWLVNAGLDVKCKSGIRVFHDYILDPAQRVKDKDGILEKELEYSQREPFWPMARYIHYLAKKNQ